MIDLRERVHHIGARLGSVGRGGGKAAEGERESSADSLLSVEPDLGLHHPKITI